MSVLVMLLSVLVMLLSVLVMFRAVNEYPNIRLFVHTKIFG